MAKDFEGKTALVTGGSRGIGRAVAVRLAQGGCAVAISYAGNDAAAQEAKAAVEAAGAPKVHTLKFDVGDAAACAAGIEEVTEKLGTLHVLVNNAGLAIDGLILRYKPEDLRRTLDVDLASPFHRAKAALRPVMKKRCGAIANLTSVCVAAGDA